MKVKKEQGGYEFSAEASFVRSRFSWLLYCNYNKLQRVPTLTMETSMLNPKP